MVGSKNLNNSNTYQSMWEAVVGGSVFDGLPYVFFRNGPTGLENLGNMILSGVGQICLGFPALAYCAPMLLQRCARATFPRA